MCMPQLKKLTSNSWQERRSIRNYTTPKSFLELSQKSFWQRTSSNCPSQNGLEALAETSAQIETLQAELEVKEVQINNEKAQPEE